MLEDIKKIQSKEQYSDDDGNCSLPQDIPCGDKCAVTMTIGLIGGKWKILILWQLRNRIRRFGELRRLIPAANKKMLTQQLRELEADDLIHRKVYAEVPPRVEYRLTETGKSLQPVVDQIGNWGTAYVEKKKASSS